MNILRQYWVWEEKFNSTEFKLGASIEPMVQRGIVFQKENELNCYFGREEYPWKIDVLNGKIQAIYFRETFPPLINNFDWDLEFNAFIKQMNLVMEPTIEETVNAQNTITVVFRDFFVAVVRISCKPASLE